MSAPESPAGAMCPHLPVVLVHGTRTSRTQWAQQRPILEAAGHAVVAPDLPGHGDRQDEPLTLEGAVATIQEALAEAAALTEHGTAHLVGTSLGAMLSIHAAAHLPRPEILASLVVAAGSIQPTPRTARLYGLGLRALDLLHGGDAVTARLLRLLLGPQGQQAYLAGGRADPGVIAPAMRAVGSLDLRGDLARLAVPVTILNGRWDQLRVHEASFTRAAAQGRRVILAYGGHMVNLSHPEQFAADLLRVLAEAEAPRTLGA